MKSDTRAWLSFKGRVRQRVRTKHILRVVKRPRTISVPALPFHSKGEVALSDQTASVISGNRRGADRVSHFTESQSRNGDRDAPPLKSQDFGNNGHGAFGSQRCSKAHLSVAHREHQAPPAHIPVMHYRLVHPVPALSLLSKNLFGSNGSFLFNMQ